MGAAELDIFQKKITIYSHIITYGHAADEKVTWLIRDEIETMWNEPASDIFVNDMRYNIVFKITSSLQPGLSDIDIYQNLDPRNNYFRIEEFARGNISFVDGLGCNSGYFKLDNLYKGSTTAAHEYGHTLGLEHPVDLDYRGKGAPGIMYPRGTIVDPPYQYNPKGEAGDGNNGGTMHPKCRRVKKEDIENLKLHRLRFVNSRSVVGAFTNIWHPDHAEMNA